MDRLTVACPHCGGYPDHRPSCLVVRARAFLARADDGSGRDDELLDFLLAFVTREHEGYLWGGIYADEKSWLCVFCGNWGNVYVEVPEAEQHYEGCPVPLAQAFLAQVGQGDPAWPWRWEADAEEHGGQWERVGDTPT